MEIEKDTHMRRLSRRLSVGSDHPGVREHFDTDRFEASPGHSTRSRTRAGENGGGGKRKRAPSARDVRHGEAVHSDVPLPLVRKRAYHSGNRMNAQGEAISAANGPSDHLPASRGMNTAKRAAKTAM